jgi:hypothetical protein
MKLVLGSLVVATLGLAPFAFAGGDHPHRQPPQAAFDACAKSKAGDACSVALHDHTLHGTCAAAPDTQALVCKPDHPPGPPPVAIEACNGHNEGDACTVSHDGHEFTGSCAHGPDGQGPLACHPAGAKGRHPHP